ncbi:IS1380 family transposase [Salinispira pacifica]|uniref:IS1380 family transposase n=1 Tax=Salinispira pacifica TaxID=1307761 RepID=UPI00059DD641|nr:IS1380 family transposase [Salinispira pacifica]
MNYQIDTTTERIFSTGGIALVGKICERIGFATNTSALVHPSVPRSLIGLFCMGRTRFEEIALFRQDTLFKESFQLPYVPAKETLRLYLERIAVQPKLLTEEVDSAVCALLQRSTLSKVYTEHQSYLPIDVDTSPLDNSKSNKEGVSRTYKQYDGYHPIFSYVGTEGYMLNCELREGKQHCQKGTPGFLKESLERLDRSGITGPKLFRLDGGNDSQDTLAQLCGREDVFFIVKRNLRREQREYWLSIAQSEGELSYRDEKKAVYTGFHTGKSSTEDESAMDIIFQVTVRQIGADGNELLFPDIEVETFWTNLSDPPETVLQFYHDHGTSEQFHSELKSDMNVERLPSGKFAVNAAVLQIAMVAFNILRFIGQSALVADDYPVQTKVKRKRLRKVIDDLVRIAVKFVHHGRTVILKLWYRDPWWRCFRKLYEKCCVM